MTNRLELNWKVDGFVDEQRYYCSETHIDPENLPAPKAVLSGEIRTYVDTSVEAGKNYYICVGSVKNGIEKLSGIKTAHIGDKYWSKVLSLLHLNNARTDEKGKTWTVVGAVTYNATIKKFGTHGARFTNSGVLKCTHTDFKMGNSDYTLECFVRPVDFLQSGGFDATFLCISDNHNASSCEIFMAVTTAGKLTLRVYAEGTYYIDTATNFSLPTTDFVHVAFCRKGLKHYAFVGGVKALDETSVAYTMPNVSVDATIGGVKSTTDVIGRFNGYIDEVRITKGEAIYTSNFTPPAKEFLNY